MASRTLLWCLLFLNVIYFCYGAPVRIGYPNVEIPVMPYYYVPAVMSIAILFVIGLVFGCTCCPNKGIQAINQQYGLHTPRQPNDVSVLENVSEFAIFPPYSVVTDQSSLRSPDDKVTFEPLPDILPRKYTNKRSSITLRPAHFGEYLDKRDFLQDWLDDSNKNFPREQLQYLKEVGCGWFGRIVEGEACNIASGEEKSPVIVKILREEASPSEHLYFLHEARPYRDLLHPNIVHLLGRCLESNPFLLIMEHTKTNLKSYLIEHRNDLILLQDGVLLRMSCNVAAGLQYMHEHSFTQMDFAAHNCFVGEDLTVKIGDYGVSFETFKEDYYYFGDVALPVRWYSPEVLHCTETTIETKVITTEANVWAFGVVLWEMFQFGELPYEDLTNEEVLQKVIIEKCRVLDEPHFQFPQKERLYQIMKFCWRSVEERLKIQDVASLLNHLYNNRNNSCESPSFEERWNALKPAQGQCFISTHANPLKFETDFVSDSNVLSKPTLFSSSDCDVSNVSEISSFEYSGYNSHRASFDSYLSPSLRVLNGSIDGLNETNAVSSCFGNASIAGVQNPTLHLSKFQNCDAGSEPGANNLRLCGAPLENSCSISLGKCPEVITSDGNNGSFVSSSDFEPHIIQEMACKNDSLPPSYENFDYSGRKPFKFAVKDTKSFEDNGKYNIAQTNLYNQTAVSLETAPEIHSEYGNQSDFTKNETAITIESGYVPNTEAGMVSDIQSTAKTPSVNSLTTSESAESPFIVNVSHSSSSTDNIVPVPDIVISKSSFDERSDILDNKSMSHSTNESLECYMPPKVDFNFVLNESANFKKSTEMESSKEVDLSLSASEVFEEEKSDTPFTSTPVKVKDTAPSKNDINHMPPYLDPNEAVFSSASNSVSTLYDTASGQDVESTSLKPYVLKADDGEFGTEETKDKLIENQNENVLNVDLLAPNLTDRSLSPCSTSDTGVTASTSKFTRIKFLPLTDSTMQDSASTFGPVHTFPDGKEQILNIQDTDSQEIPQTDETHQLPPSSSSSLSTSPSSPVDNCSDRSTSPPAKETGDKNICVFSTDKKPNVVNSEPDVFNVELVQDLKVSVDVQTLSNCSPPNVSNVNFHNAFGEFKNDHKNKIQDKIFTEASPHYFSNRRMDTETGRVPTINHHSNHRKRYKNVAFNGDLSNELHFGSYNGVSSLEKEAEDQFELTDKRNMHSFSEKKFDLSNCGIEHKNIYQAHLEMDSKKVPLNYDHKSGPEISCEFMEERSKNFHEKDLGDPITIEDLDTGEQQLVPQSVICNFDDDDDDDDDDVLKIDTETNEAIIVDSSESLVGFVPSRSIEQLQECSNLLGEEGISADQSAYQSVQEESNSCSNSPTAPSAMNTEDEDVFVTGDELSERTADILDDTAENSSVHNSEITSKLVSDVYCDETSDLPDLCRHLPKRSDAESSDLSVFRKQHNILADEKFYDISYRDSPLGSITLESEEILAGDPNEVNSLKYHKRVPENISPSDELTLNHLDIVSPIASTASTPCREVYTPDFESDSDESSSGTSCTSTSGSFECIHNKFKHVIDVSVCDDNSEGNLTNESSLESSPVKVFSKCWDSTATPTRGLLKTPEHKAVQMKKSVSFHEEGPHEIFQYPPPSDSSEDDFVDDDDFSWHVDYTSYADWDLQVGDEDDIPEEIIEIEELPCDKGLTPSYSRGISLRPLPGPMLYTLTGFTEDDLELPEVMGSSQFHGIPLEIENSTSASDGKWAQDFIPVTKSDSTPPRSESIGKPFDSLELIIEEVQSDVETTSSSDKESEFSLPSNGFADFSSDLSLKRDLSFEEKYEGNCAKYTYGAVSPECLEVEILSPEHCNENSSVTSEFSDGIQKYLVSYLSDEGKLPADRVSVSDSAGAICGEVNGSMPLSVNEVGLEAELTKSDSDISGNFISLDHVSCTDVDTNAESMEQENFQETNIKTESMVQDSSSNKTVCGEEVEDKTPVTDSSNIALSLSESAHDACEPCSILESDSTESEHAIHHSCSEESLDRNEAEQSSVVGELRFSSVFEPQCDLASCADLSEQDSTSKSSEESDSKQSNIHGKTISSGSSTSYTIIPVSCHDSFAEENAENTTSVLKEALETDEQLLSGVNSLLSSESFASDFNADKTSTSCHDSPSEPHCDTSLGSLPVNIITGSDILSPKIDNYISVGANESICTTEYSTGGKSVPAPVQLCETPDFESDDQKAAVAGDKTFCEEGMCHVKDTFDKDCLPSETVEVVESSLLNKDFQSGSDTLFDNHGDSLQNFEDNFVENDRLNGFVSSIEVMENCTDYGKEVESVRITGGECHVLNASSLSDEILPLSCYQKNHSTEDNSSSSYDQDVAIGSSLETEDESNSGKKLFPTQSEVEEPKMQIAEELVPEERKNIKFIIPSIIVTDADEFSFDDETENFIKHFGIFSATKQIADDEDSQFAIMSEFSREPFEDNFDYVCGTKIEDRDGIF